MSWTELGYLSWMDGPSEAALIHRGLDIEERPREVYFDFSTYQQTYRVSVDRLERGVADSPDFWRIAGRLPNGDHVVIIYSPLHKLGNYYGHYA